MRVLQRLALLSALVLAGGCSTFQGNDAASSSPVAIDDAGTVTVDQRAVKLDELASALRSAGYRKTDAVVVQIPDAPDRAVMKQVSAELAKGGFTRAVFTKKRKASATVSSHK